MTYVRPTPFLNAQAPQTIQPTELKWFTRTKNRAGCLQVYFEFHNFVSRDMLPHGVEGMTTNKNLIVCFMLQYNYGLFGRQLALRCLATHFTVKTSVCLAHQNKFEVFLPIRTLN